MSLSPPPTDLDLSESRVAEIIGALVTTWILATLSVVLRFVARKLKNNPLWIEDYLATFGLVG
jgi:uncharacterized membrane protein YagU involved in acid resistance